MGVPFKLVFYAADPQLANRAAAAAFARVVELNRFMSDYDADSELSRLCRTAATGTAVKVAAVKVSGPLWEVLCESQQLACETGGAFDVTAGPYVRLWRRARRQRHLPSEELMTEARAAVGYRHLELDARARTVHLTRPKMRLDLGGIAIGYTVDEMLRLLARQGITRALVDASGDIGAGDPPPGKRGWTVAVSTSEADPDAVCYVEIARGAITTSGDALQHVDIGGRRFSHVVDPRTGMALTDRGSVTVYARRCVDADRWATALSVLDPKQGIALIERKPGAAARIVRTTDRGLQTVRSSRWDALGCQNR